MLPGRDCFDRLFSLRVLQPIQPFWQRHREGLLYLLFGGLTTAVSIGSFWVAGSVLGWNEHLANTASWLLAVLFAFVTNRVWVFRAAESGTGPFVWQLLRFYGGRLATFAVEELWLLVLVTWLCRPELPVKIAGQVVVLVLNYVVSKWFVFRKRGRTSVPSAPEQTDK